MDKAIGKKGVHDMFTKSFHAKTFSRVSAWINHNLPPATAKELEEAVEAAIVAAVDKWVTS
jgi:hypothetical protein